MLLLERRRENIHMEHEYKKQQSEQTKLSISIFYAHKHVYRDMSTLAILYNHVVLEGKIV